MMSTLRQELSAQVSTQAVAAEERASRRTQEQLQGELKSFKQEVFGRMDAQDKKIDSFKNEDHGSEKVLAAVRGLGEQVNTQANEMHRMTGQMESLARGQQELQHTQISQMNIIQQVQSQGEQVARRISDNERQRYEMSEQLERMRKRMERNDQESRREHRRRERDSSSDSGSSKNSRREDRRK